MKKRIFASKRNQTYAAFLIFAAFGVLVDWFFWRGNLPTFTLNDLVQMIGTILFCRSWQIFDARDLGVKQSGLSRILTLLFTPVGVAMYFFQTRNWKVAMVGFVLFWLGYVVVVLMAFCFTVYVLQSPFPSPS